MLVSWKEYWKKKLSKVSPALSKKICRRCLTENGRVWSLDCERMWQRGEVPCVKVMAHRHPVIIIPEGCPFYLEHRLARHKD